MNEQKNNLKIIKKSRYRSVNDYFKQIFGCKVYKLSLDGGMTCPNRDGKISCGGCIFCSEGGSGDFSEKCENDVHNAIERAKLRVKDKIKSDKFVAYFQSFTNTYASIKRLEYLFFEAINRDDIVALSIATRPDCLPNEVIALLQKLNQIKPVFVELGLQTIHPSSVKFIRRGYDNCVYFEAVKKLNQIGVRVITHVILGLPGEDKKMMLETVKSVCDSGAHGIKLQLLHVLKNTDLATYYREHPFKILQMQEYFEILSSCINSIPPDMVIHRLTGDAPKKLLIAPLWSANKKAVLNGLKEYFEKTDTYQGKYYKQ